MEQNNIAKIRHADTALVHILNNPLCIQNDIRVAYRMNNETLRQVLVWLVDHGFVYEHITKEGTTAGLTSYYHASVKGTTAAYLFLELRLLSEDALKEVDGNLLDNMRLNFGSRYEEDMARAEEFEATHTTRTV